MVAGDCSDSDNCVRSKGQLLAMQQLAIATLLYDMNGGTLTDMQQMQ